MRSAGGHRFDLPEVTFCRPCLVPVWHTAEHEPMTAAFARLLEPLTLVGYATMAVVAWTLTGLPAPDRGWALAATTAFMALSLWTDLRPAPRMLHGLDWPNLALAALALVACWFGAATGAIQILLVIWVARTAFQWPAKVLVAAVAVVNVIACGILLLRSHRNPVLVTLLYLCFQAFAALLATYARRIEEARDHLTQVNADLLATRALLAETSRSNERFRVARELHDVAGHKLTALRLNLRALAHAQPDQPALGVAEQLSAELMQDIRDVVRTLRMEDGLDIAPALAALGAPFSRPRTVLHLADDLRIDDARVAEAIVRCVQEATTNAAKHGDAQTLSIALARTRAGLSLDIHDDGRVDSGWQPGNGLLGMRERVEEAGGALVFEAAPGRGMQIKARFPT